MSLAADKFIVDSSVFGCEYSMSLSFALSDNLN
jgi:hypothetical protein